MRGVPMQIQRFSYKLYMIIEHSQVGTNETSLLFFFFIFFFFWTVRSRNIRTRIHTNIFEFRFANVKTKESIENYKIKNIHSTTRKHFRIITMSVRRRGCVSRLLQPPRFIPSAYCDCSNTRIPNSARICNHEE